MVSSRGIFQVRAKPKTLSTAPSSVSTVATTTSNTFRKTPAVFTIPEILEHILSFLNAEKRRSVASQVCQEWLAICRSLISPPPLTWSLELKQGVRRKDIHAKLGTTRELQLLPMLDYTSRYRRFNSDEQNLKIWGLLVKELKCLHEEQEQGSRLIPLECLDMRDDFTRSPFLEPFLPFLCKFRSLTTIRLRVVNKPDRVFLHTVLRACPSTLKHFHVKVKAQTLDGLPLSVDALDDLRSREQWNPLEPLPLLSGLATLEIENLLLSSGCIESLVEASPNLRRLTVYQAFLIPLPWSQTTNSSPIFSRSAFIQLLGKVCLQIQDLHLSVRNQRFSASELQNFLDYQPPHLTNWSFSDQEVEISTFDRPFTTHRSHLSASASLFPLPSLSNLFWSTDPLILRAHHQRLTRLELLKSPRQDSRDGISEIQCGGALHRFLCQATHLLHLIAINVVIEIEDLDVNGVLELQRTENKGKKMKQIRQEREQRQEQEGQIWACRSLLTLHVTFDNDRNVAYPPRTSNIKVNSQIVFGYISKFCPFLRDVHIRRWSSEMSAGSGLCFLSRLRYLEHLTFTGRKFLNMRLKEMGWMRHRNQQQHSDGHWKGYSRSTTSLPGQKQEYDVDVDLSALGLSADLKNWAKESKKGRLSSLSSLSWTRTNAEGVGGCWPNLESFTVKSVLGLEYEERILVDEIKPFMQQIWPHAKISFVHEPYYTY